VATLTALVWVGVFASLGWLLWRLWTDLRNERSEEKATNIIAWVFLAYFLVTWIVGESIHLDLFGWTMSLPASDSETVRAAVAAYAHPFRRYLLVIGLVGLALASISSLAYSAIRQRTWRYTTSRASSTFSLPPRLQLILTIVSLIASVLGILSFYLDYLR
jgi:hypothetical protein